MTTTVDREQTEEQAPPAAEHDGELTLLAKVLAVPLAPFVAVWEGVRALFTQVLPRLGRAVLQAFRALGGVVSAPWRLVARAVRRIARAVSAAIAGCGRVLAAVGRAVQGAVAAVARAVAGLARAIALGISPSGGRWL